MKKNGFTLVEILAVLVLISALVIISVPSIINYINGSKNEISSVTKKIVFSGTELYLEKENVKLITNTQRYCVSLQTLVDSGLLDENISDGDVLEEVDLNKFVEVTYQFDDDLKVNKYNYQILNDCSTNMTIENGTVFYFDVTKGKVCNNYHEDNSITGYNGTISTKTTTNQNGCLKFYIFNDYSTSSRLNLLLDHNTTAVVDWAVSGKNTDGPVNLLLQLKKDTNSWIGTEIPTDYTDIFINKNINYEEYKARVITAEEVVQITEKTEWEQNLDAFYFHSLNLDETGSGEYCKNSGCKYNWLYDRTWHRCEEYGCLNNEVSVGNTEFYGYWTSSAKNDNETVAWRVFLRGGLDYIYIVNDGGTTPSGDKYNAGVRPVIEISKLNL